MSIPIGDPRRDPETRNHYVYRYFDAAGALLYVGCTMRPALRWHEHKAQRPAMCRRVARVRMLGPLNFDTARAIEKRAIETEEPIYGLTPAKYAVRQSKSAYTRRRMSELMKAGTYWADASHIAVAEAEALYGREVA